LLFNTSLIEGASFFSTIASLVYGLRFDISAIVLSNILFILFSLVPIQASFYKKIKHALYYIINIAAFVLITVDIEFFQFIGKKITFDVFFLTQDIKNQSFQLIFYYWKYFLIGLFMIIGFVKFSPKEYREPKISLKRRFVYSFLILAVSFIGIRGGFQMRSMGAKDAFIFENKSLGNIALNPIYTILRTAGKKRDSLVKYFSEEKVKEIILKNQSFHTTDFKRTNKRNVVILILESFSYEYVKAGYTPFLSSLKNKSLFYEGFANGRRSIEIMPSIFLGLPSIVSVPISQSSYQANTFYSLPMMLDEYDSSFYHGGKNGTMSFDSFAKSIGFKSYMGKNEYPNQDHFDGNWGIFDDKYFSYFVDELSKKKEPFISSVFGLSSHQPYTIPNEFKNKFKKGSLEIHESVGYVDEALRLFFEKARTKPWFKNTLFVITADHTSKLETKEYNSTLGRYRVPIVFYDPSHSLFQYKKDRNVSHVDILPSVLDYLDVEHKTKLLFGNSVFSNNRGVMLNKTASGFIFAPQNNELKRAYIQYGVNGLIRNNLYE
jgi:uncharacterized sulfatase